MNIDIRIANDSDISACVSILRDSKMGETYFYDSEKTIARITDAIHDKELYVAVGENDECFGFINYKSRGMFGSYVS